MFRMEIALILVLGFVAYIYFSAGRTRTALHRMFLSCWRLRWCIWYLTR